MVNLTNLEDLWLFNTQLCAPTDAAFQRWLEGIEDKQGVVNCGPSDDGEPSTAIVLSVDPQMIDEEAGFLEVEVTAKLDGKTLPEDTTVILSIGPSSTATRDVDYRASFRRIVILADEITGSTLLLVEPVDDAEVEGDETIVLIGEVDGLTGDEVAITIIDDDEAPDNPDRSALVALYNSTNGDNWTNDTNWLSDRPLNEWFGVGTDADGRVTLLQLGDNALSGTLPSSLGNLTNLELLDLWNNQLSGELPSSLGNLTNLRLLWLGGNAFSGSFPSWLVNLTNLQQLQLAGNQFSGALPSWLGTLTNLQDLRLQNNQFSGSLPSELGNLTRLVRLYLDENKALLDPLPSSLVKLTNLQQLYLGNTQLCAPTDAAFQSWLESIEDKVGVRNCEDGEPSTAIVLSVNPQTISEGSGETEITMTATLNGRALPENTTVTLTIDSSSSTATRDVDYAVTFGLGSIVIPAGSIAGSTTLAAVAVADNVAEGDETFVFIGSVDGLLGDEVTITIIDDDETPDNPDRAVLVALYQATNGDNWADDTNWLSDEPLGEWFGVTTDANGRVTRLELWSNQLRGTIPSELGRLANLRELNLGGNQLSGAIPSELGNLANIEWLFLHSNQLSGAIPVELGNLANLRRLVLQINQLSGAIPSELGRLANLRGLLLDRNQLSGAIPSELGRLANLEWLILSANQLSGAIPVELGRLANLRRLHLFDNQLRGAIPAELGDLSNLEQLYLFNNPGLSGPLPGSFTGLGLIEQLDLRNTQLCAPTDAAFQAWLQGIGTKLGVRNCEDEIGGSGTAKMYWTVWEAYSDEIGGKIQRANLDGSGVEDLVTESKIPSGIALDLDAGKMYWTGDKMIYRTNLDGSGVEDLVTVTGSVWPDGIALDLGTGKMYWTVWEVYADEISGKIQRANLDGSGVEDLVTGLEDPKAIALDLDAGKMYWTDQVWETQTGKIYRANLDGSGVEDLVTGLENPEAIALDLDAGKMYWADQVRETGKIQRANLDGSGVEDLVTGLGDPQGIALDLDAGKMYWTDHVWETQTGKIYRANLDGSSVEDLVTGSGVPRAIALDTSGQ